MDLRKNIYFYTDIASFPIVGAPNVLYIDKATGLIYTWSGVEYSASGAGGLKYLGLWDANANLPAIASGVGSTGEYYIVGTAGKTNIDGISDWGVGDWVIFGESTWQKIDNSESVVSDGVTITGNGTVEFPLVATGSAATPTAQTVLFADLATTEALKSCIYNNGVLGVGATLTGSVNGQLSTISFTGKIDNVTTALGQIILVWSQVDKKQNGLYSVTQLGNGSTPFIITRTTDADTQAELYPIQVNIFGGATLYNRSFLQKTADPIIGTDDIVFTTSAIGLQNTPVRHIDTVTSVALPTCTYTSGTNASLPGNGAFLEANVNGALGTINGVSLVSGNRLLVKDQANQAHNGDYVVSNIGSGSAKWKLVRVSAWGGEFVRLEREWKVNNPSSTKYGARYSTPLNSLANTAVGTTNLVFQEVATAAGRFGIADSNGAYTYYTTLTLAMTAAVAGQTIELFTDYTESGAVTITLKNGVNINGNGHTYTYTNTANNCFIDNGVAVDCQILNLKIVRQAATSTGHIFLITSGSSKIDFTGSYLFYNVATPGSFYALHNQTAATILNAYAVSTGTALFSQGSSTGQYINCFGQSTGSGNGISGNNIINSTGISVAGYGISVENAGTVINSTGISTSNTAIHGQLVRNSTAISTSGDGINGYYVVNSYARSSSGRAIAGWGNVGEFHGCVAESDSNNVANSNVCKVYNSSCRTNWNNVNGHCLSRADIIVNSALFVTNSAANCIHYIAAFNCKYANNTFSGSITPVNANVTQTIINTQDNQGNILL